MTRDMTATVRISSEELAQWQAKTSAAGVSLSELLRQAMARTRTWSAAPIELQRERTRELARIGNNLNQIARWANTHKGAAEAVQVVTHLMALERELAALARIQGQETPGAH